MKAKFVLFLSIFMLIKLTKQEITEEDRQRIQKYRQECIAETKVDPELINKADNGEFANDDTKLKCFTKCFYQKAGFINENGDLLLDVIKAKIPNDSNREKSIEVIEKCKEKKGVDACETAYLVHKCYYENTKFAKKGN